MLDGDFATMPAIPIGYPTTVTRSPGALTALASGSEGRPRTRSEFSVLRIAKSDVFDTPAGSTFTGVGEPGKKITRLSREPEAPLRISSSDSGSPNQGSAT